MADPELCRKCGAQTSAGICPSCGENDSSRLIHRDIFLLALIAAVAVAVFLFTRAMASKERHLDSQVAASWYHTGEKYLQAGDVKSAIDSLRRATSNDYENSEYHLALANALAQGGHNEEARYALLRLREAAPENSQINLQLARLEAKRGDMGEAVRYYHNALYGLWTGTEVDKQQRKVREELIQFLLKRQQRGQALSELLILEEDVPHEPAAETEVGQLFLQAGDPQHALKHFVRAERMEKHNREALAGAGEASFRMGDYRQAQRYLEAAVAIRDEGPARDLLSLTKMILSNDPLAPRLAREERNNRLKIDWDQAMLRLNNCMAEHQDNKGNTSEELQTLHADALATGQKLQPKSLRKDPELLETGVEMIDRIEETTRLSCGEPQGLDQALLLIGRKYRGGQQ